MRIDLSQDATLEAMGSYMSRLSRRQQVVASNIANIDTPGYRTADVGFHATLDELVRQEVAPASGRRGLSGDALPVRFVPQAAEVFEPAGTKVRPDGNNVDIDRELLKLGETAFGYSLMAQLLRSKFRTLSSAINEGRVGS
jgi:flagellar basal-body rod protein FlgB